MDVIILLILLIASCAGLFIQNKKIKELKNYIDTHKPIPNIDIDADPFGPDSKTKNRRGIIEYPVVETTRSTGRKKNYNVIVEVEETENLGKKSRIKIMKISGYGGDDDIKKYVEDNLAEIVEQSKIEFF